MLSLWLWFLLGQEPVKPPFLPRGDHLGLYLGPGTLEVREGMDGLLLVLDGTTYKLRHKDGEVFVWESADGKRKVVFTGRTVEIEGRGVFQRP